MQHIGLHKITAPENEVLDFMDGVELAQEYVIPITEGFLTRTARIAFLVPQDRPSETQDRLSFTISAFFFVGLFYNLLWEIREREYSDLKHYTARKKISLTGGTEFTPPDAERSLQKLLELAWLDYADLRKSLDNRILIGLLDHNNQPIFSKLNPKGKMIKHPDPDISNKLFCWNYKFQKALTAIFMSDFRLLPQHIEVLRRDPI